MLFINLIQLYLFTVTVLVVIFAVRIRTLNNADYTRAAIMLCIAVCFYILGYIMELSSQSSDQIIFWNRIEYIGIPFVSALWLKTALMYIGCYNRHKKLYFFAIFIIPFVTLILRMTNPYHHLYFASSYFINALGGLLFVKNSGPWMYVQMGHSSLMIFMAMGLFIVDSVRRGERISGKIFLIVASSLFAVSGLGFSQIHPFGLPIDYMALCLPITCAMVILAISKYDLLETKSIARSKVFEASRDAILIINRKNLVLDYNSSAGYLFKKMNIQLENRYMSVLLSGQKDILRSLEADQASIVKLKVDNEERYYDITTENIDDHNSLLGRIKTIRDVTETYKLNEELKKQAMTDELSVLSNRRAFIQTGKEWVQDAEKRGVSLHLLMMDLDHFKNVNDTYGHPIGDLTIRDFAQVLRNHFDSACLVARLGGEEFAVLLAGFDDNKVEEVVNALLHNAEQHEYNYYGNRFHVTVSIGMTKKKPGQELESMMSKADRALYQSKNRGRNCVTVI
ncbi:MAG: diguanylate cyclase [Clostridiaceae bacterium]|nr:diguanylate cyclase [Clostridiaceae bacterium]